MQFTVAQDMGTLQNHLASLTKEGKRIALVPTMGALHAGHMTLIEAAKQRADVVVVSIFVNPKQFGPNEDFAKYPRMLGADLKQIQAAGATIAYTPSVEDMYSSGFTTNVSVGDLANTLCGAFRPGHFDGVATVVAKLLLRALPHVALFGEKDYQQLCIIQRMVFDLDIPIEIVGVPTVREVDGLAMSSRNAYLSKEERALASKLYEVLNKTAQQITSGTAPDAATREGAALLAVLGFKVDYLELRQAFTLYPLNEFQPPARLLVAAWLGKTRLIDNIALD